MLKKKKLKMLSRLLVKECANSIASIDNVYFQMTCVQLAKSENQMPSQRDFMVKRSELLRFVCSIRLCIACSASEMATVMRPSCESERMDE